MHVALEKMENTSRRERVPGTFLGPAECLLTVPPPARRKMLRRPCSWEHPGPRCSPLACRPRQDETLAGLGRWRRGPKSLESSSLLAVTSSVKLDCTNFILGAIYNLQRTISSCSPPGME